MIAQGSRNDLQHKRKHDCSHDVEHRATSVTSSPIVIYSGNTSPPQWIRIFRANTSTSRRTQAAAIAYMFPHLIDKMNIRVYMRSLTAGNRRSKMELYLAIITPPPQFAERADIHTDLAQNKAVLVCDGGIDHIVTPSPPPEQGKSFIHVYSLSLPITCSFSFLYRRQKSLNGKF